MSPRPVTTSRGPRSTAAEADERLTRRDGPRTHRAGAVAGSRRAPPDQRGGQHHRTQVRVVDAFGAVIEWHRRRLLPASAVLSDDRCELIAADFFAGVHLYGAITTALYEREKTGIGRQVEVAMIV